MDDNDVLFAGTSKQFSLLGCIRRDSAVQFAGTSKLCMLFGLHMTVLFCLLRTACSVQLVCWAQHTTCSNSPVPFGKQHAACPLTVGPVFDSLSSY